MQVFAGWLRGVEAAKLIIVYQDFNPGDPATLGFECFMVFRVVFDLSFLEKGNYIISHVQNSLFW